jgi:hypothetical protein
MLDTTERHRDDRAPLAAFVVPSAPRRLGTYRYVDRLRTDLGITAAQSAAWEEFAASLRANGNRVHSSRDANAGTLDVIDVVFGPRRERLAALGAMKIAASELFAVLTSCQRHRAQRLLPLCCVPVAARASSVSDAEPTGAGG